MQGNRGASQRHKPSASTAYYITETPCGLVDRNNLGVSSTIGSHSSLFFPMLSLATPAEGGETGVNASGGK